MAKKYFKAIHKNGTAYLDKAYMVSAYEKEGFKIEEITAETFKKYKKQSRGK